ncbi:MAG: hypothetical protein DMG96_34540 [Acidobacteria bacterium]|nr:MAG: hypothetical protein DMG98_26610 [Acidobacteriota bacterium]PYV69235.1 MAG: hypothetical protein DMG96_34540 [Acidobacteriota bacterium]
MNDPSTSLELTKSSSGSVSDEDIELKAIQTVLTALSGLRGEARSRVVEYVFKRLGLMSEAVPISTAVGDYQLPTPADIARSTSTKDIRSLTQEKAPRSSIEMAALVAYYLSELAPPPNRKGEITAEDIKKYFKQASFRLPGSSRMTLVNAKNAGYLDSSAPGSYKLNPVGYNLVAHAMPLTKEKPVRKRKRTAINKRSKSAK